LAGPLARVSVVPICPGAFLGVAVSFCSRLDPPATDERTADLVLVFRRISARLVASGLVANRSSALPGRTRRRKHEDAYDNPDIYLVGIDGRGRTD